MATLHARLDDALYEQTMARAGRDGVSSGAIVRAALAAYLATTEPSPAENKETDMRPRTGNWNAEAIAPKRRGKHTKDAPLSESEKVRPPRTTCPVCGTETWADDQGAPRPHLRPARPGDPGWSDIVPVKVSCTPDDEDQAHG